MARLARSYWPLVVALLAVFLVYESDAKQARPQDWAVVPVSLDAQGALIAANVIRVEYIPDPNDIVNLAEGTPYTVPAGKVLIITDWVTTNAQGAYDSVWIQPRIRVNGIDVWGGGFGATYSGPGLATSGTSTLSGLLHSGVRANDGDVVTLHTLILGSIAAGGNPTTFASGFLAKAE